MNWLEEMNKQNQTGEEEDLNFVQKLNADEQISSIPESSPIESNWLGEMEAENKAQTISKPSQATKWLGDMKGDLTAEKAVEGVQGTAEAIGQLGWAAYSFIPSMILGGTAMGTLKTLNLLGDKEQKISPKQIHFETKVAAGWLPSLAGEPKTETGRKISENVGEFFHKLFSGPRAIGEDMTEFYGPNIGWASEQVLTLGLCKFMHACSKELKTGINKVTKAIKERAAASPKMKEKANELNDLMKDIEKSKTPSDLDARFQRKVDELEAIMQAENLHELEIWQKKQAKGQEAILPHEATRPIKLAEAPAPELNPIAQRILDLGRKESVKANKKLQERIDQQKLERYKEYLETLKPEDAPAPSLRLAEQLLKKGREQKISAQEALRELTQRQELVLDTETPLANKPFKIPEAPPVELPEAFQRIKEFSDMAKKVRDSKQKDSTLARQRTEDRINKPKIKPMTIEDIKKGKERRGEVPEHKRQLDERAEEKVKDKTVHKTEKEIEPDILASMEENIITEVKDGLTIAKDMGIYKTILQALEAKKTRKEIMSELKKEEYYKEDLKDLNYNPEDIKLSIRAIDIAERKNSSSLQKLQEQMKREAKTIEDLNQRMSKEFEIDPETGRLPGVEKPKPVKKDLGTSDILAEYHARQQPVKLSGGEGVAKSEFMARRSAEAQGLIGELVKDPHSEGWLLKPTKEQIKAKNKQVKREWDEQMREVEGDKVKFKKEKWEDLMEEEGFNPWNEKGSITLDMKDVKKIRDFLLSRKIKGVNAEKLLQAQGISRENINLILDMTIGKKTVPMGEPDQSSQWLKPNQKPEQLIAGRKLPGNRTAPAVKRGDARIIEQAHNINAPVLGEKVRHMQTSEGIFTSIGKELRNLFYRKATEIEKRASDISVDLIKQSNALKKTLPLFERAKSSERIDNYAVSQQEGGVARLKNMGVDIVTELTPKETVVYDALQKLYKELYPKINKERVAAGYEAFPAEINYSMWAHDLSKLKELKNVTVFDKNKKVQDSLKDIREIPSLRDRTGRATSMKGHEKHRGGVDTPGYLELDAFRNFERYAMIAGDAIGKTSKLAYMHELMHPRFELYKNAPNTYNFLNEWLDYQKGKEPIMFITNPRARRILSKLSSNIAVSYLTYALRSSVVQFSSLNNTLAEVGVKRFAQGSVKLTSPEEIKRAQKASNILSTRTPESILMDAADSYPLFPGKTGKVLHKVGKEVKQKGILPLSFTDTIVSYGTWFAAEAEGISRFKKSLEYKKLDKSKRAKATQDFARDFADDAVVRAQGSAARSARAPIQRTAEGKFITTLQTFTIANFDYLSRHVLGIRNPDITKPQQVRKIMTWLISSTLISQAFDQAGWNSPIPQPVKAYNESMGQTDNKVKAIKESALELLEFIPIYGGKYKYESELTGAVAEQLVRLGGGDMTALPRLMGQPGFSTLLKGYRAYDADGTAADILLGRYIEKKKKRSRGIKGVKGL